MHPLAVGPAPYFLVGGDDRTAHLAHFPGARASLPLDAELSSSS